MGGTDGFTVCKEFAVCVCLEVGVLGVCVCRPTMAFCHLVILVFVPVPKVIYASAVREGQRAAPRFRLDQACLWFSISTCHRRRAAGGLLP